MISLIIPAFTGGPNLERTIESCRGLCDDVVIISTALFDDDFDDMKKTGATVVIRPWNFVFLHGFGPLYNQGTEAAKNNWLMLLGVAETMAEEYCGIHQRLKASLDDGIFKCDHVNDPNKWKRVWNRNGRTMWSGIIHEEISFGRDMEVIFRMQDTEKTPHADPFRNEVFRYIKALSYNYLYERLLLDPSRLGGTNHGWIDFVNRERDSITGYCDEHREMLNTCIAGDKNKFLGLVGARLDAGDRASGVKFQPQGA